MSLILDIVFLNLFGIIMIYSASYYYAEHSLGLSPFYYFKSQIIYFVAGLAAMIAVGFIRPDFWRHFGWIALFLAFGMLIAVRIPGIGHASHGAYRWVKLPGGVTIQVAEPIKIALIVFMAMAMTRYRITDKFVLIGMFSIFIIMAGMLLVLSNNLSTAIIIMMMLFAPMSIFAQKFGHVDTQSIFQTLPDIARINGELQAMAQEKDNELQAMQQEFQRKLEDYQKTQSTMNQTKKDEVEKELTEMSQKIQQANQDAQMALQQAQEEKLTPVRNKIHTAIENVGKAGNFTYIFETNVAVYIGPDSKDVTADVKAELAKMK